MNHDLERPATSGRILTWIRGGRRLERATREASLRMEGRLSERGRIARELHDTLLEGFHSASVLVGAELNRLPPDSPARAPLQRAMCLLERALGEGRDAVLGLRSPTAASMSLEQALSGLKDELMPFSDIRFQVLVVGQTRQLNPELWEHLYHIAREAFVNALRHSRATKVEAEIEYARRQVQAVLRDNGCGMDPEILRSRHHTHLGIRGMCERARSIGAELKIWSRPNGGTEVVVSARTVCSRVVPCEPVAI